MNLSPILPFLKQQKKLLLTVLGSAVLVTGCVYTFPRLFAADTAGSEVVAQPPPALKQAAGMTKMPVKRVVPAANIKNPFQIPAHYQMPKEAAGSNSPAGSVPNPAAMIPALSGIITRGMVKVAILDLGGNSEILETGGSFGEYTVTSITATQVVLHGPSGRLVLHIGR